MLLRACEGTRQSRRGRCWPKARLEETKRSVRGSVVEEEKQDASSSKGPRKRRGEQGRPSEGSARVKRQTPTEQPSRSCFLGLLSQSHTSPARRKKGEEHPDKQISTCHPGAFLRVLESAASKQPPLLSGPTRRRLARFPIILRSTMSSFAVRRPQTRCGVDHEREKGERKKIGKGTSKAGEPERKSSKTEEEREREEVQRQVKEGSWKSVCKEGFFLGGNQRLDRKGGLKGRHEVKKRGRERR